MLNDHLNGTLAFVRALLHLHFSQLQNAPFTILMISPEVDIRTPQSSKNAFLSKYLIFMGEYHQNPDSHELAQVVQI